MKLLIDMNLSPRWAAELTAAGHEAWHWSQVGDVHAADAEIMEWARTNGAVVFTHDLDFTTILAFTRGNGPSVVQLRAQNIFPDAISATIVELLADHAEALAAGAILTVDHAHARLRLLPLT